MVTKVQRQDSIKSMHTVVKLSNSEITMTPALYRLHYINSSDMIIYYG